MILISLFEIYVIKKYHSRIYKNVNTVILRKSKKKHLRRNKNITIDNTV